MASETETPVPRLAVARHMEYFACGCTTTRVERILLPQPDERQCIAHGGSLTKIVHATDFEPEPTEEALALHYSG